MRLLSIFTHLKISRMLKKKDVYGLLNYLAANIDKNQVIAGKAMMALARIGKPSAEAICKMLPGIKHNFLKFTLIRILYSIGDPDSVGSLISIVKDYGVRVLRKDAVHELNRSGETSVYFIALKTLKHLGSEPGDWGISSEAYYEQVREDYSKCED
ncbi:MAG: HEAT repeat domain-containing protein [Candidatus Odinarchaeota archaeon]